MSHLVDESDKKEDKTLIDNQKELTQNVRLWYADRFYIGKGDRLSTIVYKICVRILITIVMIAFSPILFIVLIVALVGAG